MVLGVPTTFEISGEDLAGHLKKRRRENSPDWFACIAMLLGVGNGA